MKHEAISLGSVRCGLWGSIMLWLIASPAALKVLKSNDPLGLFVGELISVGILIAISLSISFTTACTMVLAPNFGIVEKMIVHSKKN